MDYMPSFEKAQERRQEMREALGGLELSLAQASSGPGWRDEVARAMSRLQASIQAHVDEVESDEGLLAQLLSDAPRLENLVHILERDHRRLLDECRSIRADVENAEPARIRARCVELMGDLSNHRQQGADLVWSAYSEDIGGQGGG